MRWALVPGHNLGAPFIVAMPLQEDTTISTIVPKMSDLEEPRGVHSAMQSNHLTQPASVITLASCNRSKRKIRAGSTAQCRSAGYL